MGLQVADVLAGMAMRHVRAHLDGQDMTEKAGDGRRTFQRLLAASNPERSVGINMIVPERVWKAVQR